MKPGNKQDMLARLWNNVVVLVVEEARVGTSLGHGNARGSGGPEGLW